MKHTTSLDIDTLPKVVKTYSSAKFKEQTRQYEGEDNDRDLNEEMTTKEKTVKYDTNNVIRVSQTLVTMAKSRSFC